MRHGKEKMEEALDKAAALESIAEEIRACPECRVESSGLAVPGEGNPDAEIVFIGEAPGKEEAKTGRPFAGRSGKLLRSCISDIGLSEEVAFITSPVKYLPDRGTPSAAAISHGRTHLERQLAVIRPRIIVLLGATACSAVLGRKLPISEIHGTTVEKDGRTCLITFHPAAAVRFPRVREGFLKDFEELKRLIAGKDLNQKK